ncbi:Transforming growth factor-beta-induced protein ig-h3 [Daldinia childiae]|uniref:Transforming growth factor-beta-induced protein ig-h3 n=1 Tax=Daldinia childiae TaxID=326645 RepID=UPI001447E1B5|nr:Transforming growth factor-beta-induced protein ig-h3 [Daldinia childiae]KAF3065261.1 Transforming growth factor-beta-induced protein ig-h3 [Daldinia childiae]
MQYMIALPLALASLAAAQTPSLSDALGSQNSSLSSLNALLASNSQFSESLNRLQNVTILAPSNDALSAVTSNNESALLLANSDYLQALLSYHILNGTYHNDSFGDESVFIPTLLTNKTYTNVTGGQVVEAQLHDNNVTFFSALKENATIITPNVNFTGGTIHIIDRVLAIPQNVTETLSNANLTAAEGAISTANLTDSVVDTPNITIFAPNNDAFNAIGSIIGNLTSDQLTNIAGYHVVNGSVNYSADLQNTTLTAANGQDITITILNGTAYANSAKITVPDILLENGVVHVIDQVLNPDNTSAAPDTTASSATPAFTNASSGSEGVPFTSGVTTPTTTFPAATSAGGEAESSSSEDAAMPMKTGAVGAAALFGGVAIIANL